MAPAEIHSKWHLVINSLFIFQTVSFSRRLLLLRINEMTSSGLGVVQRHADAMRVTSVTSALK